MDAELRELCEVKRYRPKVVKDGNCRHGFGVRMVTSENPADSDWRGEDSREWVKYSDYATLLDTLAALAAELEGVRGELIAVYRSIGNDEMVAKHTAIADSGAGGGGVNPDSAHLDWHADSDGGVWASSVVHDDGWPLLYSFKLVPGGCAFDGDDELITGPRPANFRSIDQAKAWAAQTEFKWLQRSVGAGLGRIISSGRPGNRDWLADTTPKEGGDAR